MQALPLPLTPAPSQPHIQEQQKLRGHEGKIPTELGYTASSELRLFTFPVGVSRLLPSGCGGDTADMTAAAALAASLIWALGNNFPPRAPRPRKLLCHFRVVVSDALEQSSGWTERVPGWVLAGWPGFW